MGDRKKRIRELESEMSVRHLRFARRVAEGNCSLKSAYSEVYPDAAPSACDTTGSRLLGNARVSEYIELITGEASDTFVVNRTQVMEKLWELGCVPVSGDSKSGGAVASSLKTLLDYLAPKVVKSKVELTGAGGGPVKTENTDKGLSDEMARSVMMDVLGLTDEQADAAMGKLKEKPGQ